MISNEQMNKLQEATKKLRNDEVLKAADAVKADNGTLVPEHQQAFVEALLNGRYIAPASIADNDGNNDPNKVRITFSQIANKEGKKFFMLFSDYESFTRNVKDAEKVNLLSLTYKDLAEMLSTRGCNAIGFVINPFTDNIIVGPEQGKLIAQYVQHKNYQDGKAIVFRDFEDVPDEVVRPIEKYLDNRKDVKKAYLICMQKVDKINRLIIADVDEGKDFNEFAKEMGEELLRDMNDEKMPYLILNYNTDVGKKASEGKVPIYVRV